MPVTNLRLAPHPPADGGPRNSSNWPNLSSPLSHPPRRRTRGSSGTAWLTSAQRARTVSSIEELMVVRFDASRSSTRSCARGP